MWPQSVPLIAVVALSLYSKVVATIAIHASQERSVLTTNSIIQASNHNGTSGLSTFTDVYWPLDVPVAIYPPSLNTTSYNISTPGVPNYSCNGAVYGRNLNLASCYQVWRIMSSDGAMETYGQRGSGNWRAKLPFRYVSSDGLCAIDISHSARASHDQMRPGDLKDIVRVLIDVCVRGTPNQGGIASNIGVHGNLAVRVVPYKPKVVCGAAGSGPPFISCRDIVDEMPADGKKNVFGPKDDPETTVPIPYALTTRAQRCNLLLKSQTQGVEVKDTSDWYKIFAAVNAIDFMCTLKGRDGTAYDLVQNFNLMAVFDAQDKRRGSKSDWKTSEGVRRQMFKRDVKLFNIPIAQTDTAIGDFERRNSNRTSDMMKSS